EVTVEGAQRNAQESIRDLIDIHAGDGWTLARKMLAERRLKTCGRFFHGDVSLVPGTTNPSAGTVLVRVRECDLVPSLDEALTPDDQVLIRCARWLESLPHDDLDVVIEAQFEPHNLPDGLAVPVGPVNLRLAISPESGLIIESTVAGLGDQPLRYVAMSHPQRLSLHSGRTHSRYDITFDNAPVLSANFSIAGIPEAVSKERTKQFGYGLSFNRDDRPYRPLQFSINPAVFLSDSRREGVVRQRKDGHVVFQGSDVQARIEEATGRLVSVEVLVEGFGQFRISTESGAFDRIFSELDKQTTQVANAADPQRPFSSALQFIAAEVTAVATDLGQDELTTQIEAWQKLLVGQLVPRLDALFERWDSSDDVFTIPPPAPETGLQTHWATSMFLQANALLFAHDAGPGTPGPDLAAALLLRYPAALKSSLRIGQST